MKEIKSTIYIYNARIRSWTLEQRE